MPGAPSRQKIIDAWHSVTDEWIVRRNKSRSPQWEVLHSWGDPTIIDEGTQKVVKRFENEHAAHEHRDDLENLARASAVQSMFSEWNNQK